MTSDEIKTCLLNRWIPTEYVMCEEAPTDAWRQGRKIDALFIACWASRGFEIDAIEIKVTHGDWMREVNDPTKSEFWVQHSHRFWAAVPVKIASKVAETLPFGWGLLACSDDKTLVVKKPITRKPEPMQWTTVIGMLRAAQNCSWRALERAEQRGYERGQADASVTPSI